MKTRDNAVKKRKARPRRPTMTTEPVGGRREDGRALRVRVATEICFDTWGHLPSGRRNLCVKPDSVFAPITHRWSGKAGSGLMVE